VKNFKPEPFWSIKITHKRDDINVTFLWNRNRLFDRAAVTIQFERCLAAKLVKVSKVQQKPTRKWKPLPLSTVEFQKLATRFLSMNGQRAMQISESLYNKGFISYPRTETDRFDRGMNLRELVEKQVQDQRWGQFAQNLVGGGFNQPREGRNDDRAHPPIHPIKYCAPGGFESDEARRVYELITRRFLACCSEDALGTARDIDVEFGDEGFHAHGVVVEARNYLDVYPYENWTGNLLPQFTLGERFEPDQAMMTEGKTTAPGYLTEPDLIALMDANGIGTDATMAEHIAKVKERAYVMTQLRGVNHDDSEYDEEEIQTTGGGRGSRGVRSATDNTGGRGSGGGTNRGRRIEEFIPTTLGVGLIKGYDEIGLDTSLGKPFLRKEMELRMKQICDGHVAKEVVVRESVREYKRMFQQTEEQIGVLKAVSLRGVKFW
jgi:DNA topoisomerase-3